MAGGRIGNLVFAQEPAALQATDETLVVVFLRGGLDGLSLVAPLSDAIYQDERRDLALPTTGANRGLELAVNNASFTSSMALHPKAAPLKELYDARKLAIIHACGLENDTRSHFEAMDCMERGTPNNKNTPSGWLARHIQSGGISGLVPSLAASASTPVALLGSADAVSMANLSNFHINSTWRYVRDDVPYSLNQAVSAMYQGDTGLTRQAGQRTLGVLNALPDEIDDYVPTPGVTYPGGGFGESLQAVAQAIKLDLGLRVATVDYGGWDTHEDQGNNGEGYFADQVDRLSRGLHALYTDLPNHQNRLTIVVMSEFGRRLGVNSSSGTDHGHGNLMLVLGGNTNGGNMYGRWPGLEDLDQSQDLRITTDYRAVLSEILIRRLGNPQLGTIFPGLTSYAPSGIVRGNDLAPVFSSAMQPRVYLPLVRR